jgi:predicted TIM-barrel enzyme
MTINKESIIKRLRRKIDAGHPLVCGNAGTAGIVKQLEGNGADLIVLDNSGDGKKKKQSVLSCLMAYGNANEAVSKLAGEAVKAVKSSPLVAGVCATDPFLIQDAFLKNLTERGFAGVQNFPSVGIFDGSFRANLERTGISFSREVEFVKKAGGAGMLAVPIAFTPEDAMQMVGAGADIIVANTGFAGMVDSEEAGRPAPENSIETLNSIIDAVKSLNDTVLVLCCNARVSGRDDARNFLDKCSGLDGFFAASYMTEPSGKTTVSDCIRNLHRLRF